ncbi:membrane protein [Arthrobacter phage Atuin]|nr:membrane protein [Arthrobacter phage Atuin]
MTEWIKWIVSVVVVGVLVLFGGYMIGNAVYDSKRQGVDISIQCIKAGGTPFTDSRNGNFECRK